MLPGMLGRLWLLTSTLALATETMAGPPARTAGPTPTPVEEILDLPSEAELRVLMQKPSSPDALAALAKVRAAAAERRDDRKWFGTLIQEVRLLAPLVGTHTGGEAVEAAWARAAERVEKSETPWSAGMEVARLLLLADIHDIAARSFQWIPATGSSIQAREARASEAAYQRAFSRRVDLQETPRSALVFAASTWSEHGTARDVVTYLYSAFLESQVASEPTALSSTLSITDLLGPLPGRTGAQPRPLVRLCGILDDLERWHSAAGRRSAALEARLERLRVLFRTFTAREVRDAVIADLRVRLDRYRDDPGWSAGMAQLALFVNESATRPEVPLAIADEGQRAYPGTAGGQRCDTIARILRLEIQDPEASVSMTGRATSGQPIVSIRHRRAGTVYFRAIPIPVEAWLDTPYVAFRPSHKDSLGKPAGEPAADAITWSTAMPGSNEGEPVTTRSTLPLPKRGPYRVEMSLDPEFGEHPLAMNTLVSDLVLTISEDPSTLYVRALSAASGQPVAAASIRLLMERATADARELIGPVSTDSEGLARFPHPRSRSMNTGSTAVTITAKSCEDVASIVYYLQSAGPDATIRVSHLAVDRPRAGPGDRIRWRALARNTSAEGKGVVPLAGRPLQLALRDGRGTLLEKFPLGAAGRLGTSHGEIVLPSLPPDQQHLRLDLETVPGRDASPAVSGPVLASAYISRPEPARHLDVTLEAPLVVAGTTVRISGRALREGMPLPGASISWTLMQRYISGAPSRVGDEPYSRAFLYLASEETVADHEGRFLITVPVPRTQRMGTIDLTLDATVKDPDGDSATRRLDFRAFSAAVSLEIRGSTVILAGETPEFTLRCLRSADRAPRPCQTSVRILRPSLSAPEIPFPDTNSPDVYRTSQPGAVPVMSSEGALEALPPGEAVSQQEIQHDEAGEARLTLPRLHQGLHRLIAETRDEHGFVATTSRWLIVDGPAVRLPLPVTLLGESGDSGPRRLYAASDGSAPVLLEVYRPGKPLESLWLEVAGGRVVDLASGPFDSVLVRAFSIRHGQLFMLQKAVSRRSTGLRIQLRTSTPVLEARVTSDEGQPIENAEVTVAACLGPFYIGGLDPRHDLPSSIPSLHVANQGPAWESSGIALRPPSASEWGRVSLPDLPRERPPLFAEISNVTCGNGMGLPPSPRLPLARRPSYTPVPLPVTSESRDAVLWEPSLHTDRQGLVQLPLKLPDGRPYRLFLSAVARDGQVGYFDTVVDGTVEAETAAP